mgnify:CR=1 FL=1
MARWEDVPLLPPRLAPPPHMPADAPRLLPSPSNRAPFPTLCPFHPSENDLKGRAYVKQLMKEAGQSNDNSCC